MRKVREIEKVFKKILYLLSFVIAAIITCLIFNSLICDIGRRVKNKEAAVTTAIKGENINEGYEEIKLIGILHMNWYLTEVTNVIFNNGCIYLNRNGIVVESFKYDYPYSVRHMQETVKWELNAKYRSNELSISEAEEFLATYFGNIDYSERDKTFREMIQRRKIEVYDLRASELSYQDKQRMMKLIEERGINKILHEENWFIDW